MTKHDDLANLKTSRDTNTHVTLITWMIWHLVVLMLQNINIREPSTIIFLNNQFLNKKFRFFKNILLMWSQILTM